MSNIRKKYRKYWINPDPHDDLCAKCDALPTKDCDILNYGGELNCFNDKHGIKFRIFKLIKKAG